METTTPKEDKSTKKCGCHSAKISSMIYLGLAVGSMGLSLTLKCLGRGRDALFIGQWAAPFLIMGLYHKIVKAEGHDNYVCENIGEL